MFGQPTSIQLTFSDEARDNDAVLAVLRDGIVGYSVALPNVPLPLNMERTDLEVVAITDAGIQLQDEYGYGTTVPLSQLTTIRVL